MEFNSVHTSWKTIRAMQKSGHLEKEERSAALFRHANQHRHDRPSLARAMYLEGLWCLLERPYYNVYPAILDMLLDVDMDLPAGAVELPLPLIAVRFPKDDTRMHSCIVGAFHEGWFDSAVKKGGDLVMTWKGLRKDEDRMAYGIVNYKSTKDPSQLVTSCIQLPMTVEKTVQECMDGGGKECTEHDADHFDEQEHSQKLAMAIQIVTGLSILANDPNFVQPIVLNKDLKKYENADEETKRLIEVRAARRQGRGFTVGKQLEEDLAREAVSPHFRRPHMALFWTGKGRQTPRLQLRRGTMVNPRDVTNVPTGFLDREKSEDDPSNS